MSFSANADCYTVVQLLVNLSAKAVSVVGELHTGHHSTPLAPIVMCTTLASF